MVRPTKAMRERRRARAQIYARENAGRIRDVCAWYRYTHREEIRAKREYRLQHKKGKPYPLIRAYKMKGYKVQLHPTAEAFTVEDRESVERIISLYRRFCRFGLTAYPYFVYPIDESKLLKPGFKYGALIGSTFGEDTRENVLQRLSAAIWCLNDREAGIYKPVYSPIYGVDEDEKPGYERALAEARSILSLIREYATGKA